jgi:sarcosine oxidase subunit beta
LINHARGDVDLLSMVRSTVTDITALELSSGQPIGFRRSGSLRIAQRHETAQQLKHIEGLLHGARVEASFIDAKRAHALVPWLRSTAASSILHVADDGYVDGQSLAMAYARAAKAGGATIWTNTAVLGPRFERGQLIGVDTSRGPIRCERVINAAGPWAGNVLGWFDRALAATPLRSHYWITAPLEPRWPDHPIVVLPDAHAYIRPEIGGLLVGIQERVSRSFDDRTLPVDMSELALSGPDDWDLLAEHAPELRRYLPAVDELQFKHHLAGITTYTPDGRFLIGAIAGVENLFVAAGCCGTGLSCAGGIGRLVCDLVLERTPDVNAAQFNPNRFASDDPRSADFVARCVAARATKGRRA